MKMLTAVYMIIISRYESLIETLKLLSIPGFYESIQKANKEIREGDTYSWDEVFGDEL